MIFFQIRLVELDDLAGVEAAVAGEDKADDADQRKQVQVCAAKHLDAQHDGGDGRIGCAAEQTDEAQSAADSRIKAQEASQQAAEGGADTEGGHDFAALEARSQGHSGKDHFQEEAVPIGVALHGFQGHIHACAVEPVVPNDQGQHHHDGAADGNSDIGIGHMVLGKVLYLQFQLVCAKLLWR